MCTVTVSTRMRVCVSVCLCVQLSAEEVMKFFEPCGKINFVRMAGDETQPTR